MMQSCFRIYDKKQIEPMRDRLFICPNSISRKKLMSIYELDGVVKFYEENDNMARFAIVNILKHFCNNHSSKRFLFETEQGIVIITAMATISTPRGSTITYVPLRIPYTPPCIKKFLLKAPKNVQDPRLSIPAMQILLQNI